MVFSSPLFLTCFLPLLFLLYWLSRENLRNCLLVIFSIFFYAWGEPKAVFCMLGMIGFNFYLGRKIETEGSKPDKNSAKITLILGIVSNLGILFVYKYLNFSVENINYFFFNFNYHPRDKFTYWNFLLLFPMFIVSRGYLQKTNRSSVFFT